MIENIKDSNIILNVFVIHFLMFRLLFLCMLVLADAKHFQYKAETQQSPPWNMANSRNNNKNSICSGCQVGPWQQAISMI